MSLPGIYPPNWNPDTFNPPATPTTSTTSQHPSSKGDTNPTTPTVPTTSQPSSSSTSDDDKYSWIGPVFGWLGVGAAAVIVILVTAAL